MRYTKRLFASASAAMVLVALDYATATADSYHAGPKSSCSDCHVSSAGITPASGLSSPDLTQSPALFSTTDVSSTQTCLNCHDNKPGIPDVVGVDINNPNERYDGTERAGGQFSDLGTTNWKGHSLPGQGPNAVEGCTACHDPHGNAYYCDLKSLDGSPEGPIAFVNPAATGLEQYRRVNIGYVRNISEMCGRCHECAMPASMLAPTGGGRYQRHPNSTSQMVITIDGTRTSASHWVSGIGSGFVVHGERVPRLPFAVRNATSYFAATTVTANNEVICLSCHKAHGSSNAFGMQWSYGTGDGLTSSSGCNQCHNVSGE